MELPELGPISEFLPVPKVFHSFERDQPFSHCTICDEYLLDDGTLYLIEKAFKQGEVIFEYAMCMCCRGKVEQTLSRGSLAAIDRLFDEHVDLVERRAALITDWEEGADPWLEKCVLLNRPTEPDEEYQILTLCDGPDLVFGYMPYMLSGAAMDLILERLSKQTKDSLDDFTDEFLGLPPELKDLKLVFV